MFWRDPSIGLLGAYGSYSQWNGTSTALIPRTAMSIGRYAAEGELYLGRWTFGGVVGYESVRFNIPGVVPGLPTFSIPNRFFDAVDASYYVTDDFKLSIGHIYTTGRNALTLGSEYGFALGGGRMASLFADGIIGESGLYVARAGLRIYFGQHDKTLIDRNRQDDPTEGYSHLDAVARYIGKTAVEIADLEASGAVEALFKRITQEIRPATPATAPGPATTSSFGSSFIP